MGGGLFVGLYDESTNLELINITCIRCHSNYGGGGGAIQTDYGQQITLQSQCLFQDCSSNQNAGGLFAYILGKSLIEINNASFKNCSAETRGGGLYAIIGTEGQLIIDSSTFFQCESFGNGGGIIVEFSFIQQNSFIIKDTIVQKCKALNSTNSLIRYSASGFGGGLFLGIYEDYDPTSELIDLRGMNIYNNSADKFGQSLYIAMPKVVEWCQYGILGEYVKGNYSDKYSNETDLEGIPMDYGQFSNLSPYQIQLESKPLEHWWRILGILYNAQVTVNESNTNEKLIFHIGGQRMIPGYLNKLYGVLISNDGEVFTGKDGHTIEEDANAAVSLEVMFEGKYVEAIPDFDDPIPDIEDPISDIEQELEQDIKPETKERFSFPYWGIILIAAIIGLSVKNKLKQLMMDSIITNKTNNLLLENLY
ncbi:MAG: hypothetical protein EZS28_011161 [Streblomastix strix]|uniref:Uncharacterized protein n=1 Tax=Streblomastix strix TaxID=222440 RepID=A0A5J4WEC7_9EUKA|nr:MAG: hypothetical protein EZS28_011161 [Streblomastix strix]